MINFILSLALADRIRGIKSWLVILPAFILGQYLDNYWFSITYIAGEFAGWSNPLTSVLLSTPMQKNYHWWQRGRLRKNRLLALFTRGVLWALPVALIDWRISFLWPFIFTASPYIARSLYMTDRPISRTNNAWELNELIRGSLFAIATIIGIHL